MIDGFLNLRVFYWHLQLATDAPFVRIVFGRYAWEHGISWRWVQTYPIAIGKWS